MCSFRKWQRIEKYSDCRFPEILEVGEQEDKVKDVGKKKDDDKLSEKLEKANDKAEEKAEKASEKAEKAIEKQTDKVEKSTEKVAKESTGTDSAIAAAVDKAAAKVDAAAEEAEKGLWEGKDRFQEIFKQEIWRRKEGRGWWSMVPSCQRTMLLLHLRLLHRICQGSFMLRLLPN